MYFIGSLEEDEEELLLEREEELELNKFLFASNAKEPLSYISVPTLYPFLKPSSTLLPKFFAMLLDATSQTPLLIPLQIVPSTIDWWLRKYSVVQSLYQKYSETGLDEISKIILK
ncbi:hypothetical protein [endosymbiont GvMRE of Glomus versiforme]|uniref:hypothetical protein n=1 Tax=endosymbiont GvMRE of Glomus versiforme TaxID=2039283 RepID=UPI0011C3C3BB|nr:hypothetical protein [endosymbiont GvMRE of Glomus versiforme]